MNENLGIARWRLPSVDQALRAPSGRQAVDSFGHQAAVEAIRGRLAAHRTCPRSG